MIDIVLIREKPDWVKEKIRTLQEESAVARIDAILELDQKRRALLTEGETLQAERNKLNKMMGRFRGNKALTPAQQSGVADAIVAAIAAKDYARAFEFLTHPPSDLLGEAAPPAAPERLSHSPPSLVVARD